VKTLLVITLRGFQCNHKINFSGYESLANDADVEVVYVGAIHPAHLEICKLMLNAGKHILCEKVNSE
jgi:predicted dehydrogenase